MAISYFSQTARGNKGALKTALITACIVAVVDGLAAIVVTWTLHGRSPLLVFRYIASGLLGTAAFSGGLSPAVIGVICHFFISLVWTTIFLFRPPQSLCDNTKSGIKKHLIWCDYMDGHEPGRTSFKPRTDGTARNFRNSHWHDYVNSGCRLANRTPF